MANTAAGIAGGTGVMPGGTDVFYIVGELVFSGWSLFRSFSSDIILGTVPWLNPNNRHSGDIFTWYICREYNLVTIWVVSEFWLLKMYWKSQPSSILVCGACRPLGVNHADIVCVIMVHQLYAHDNLHNDHYYNPRQLTQHESGVEDINAESATHVVPSLPFSI